MESRLIIVGANKNDVVLTDLLKKVLKIKPENVVLSWQYNNEKGVIVALGMDAVESVIGKSKEKISKLRGEFIVSENYQLMPTFSTNYAIRTEANLKLLAEDIEKAYKLLNLTLVQQEALANICQKIARIITGNPNHADNWHDIAGYATLAENAIDNS